MTDNYLTKALSREFYHFGKDMAPTARAQLVTFKPWQVDDNSEETARGEAAAKNSYAEPSKGAVKTVTFVRTVTSVVYNKYGYPALDSSGFKTRKEGTTRVISIPQKKSSIFSSLKTSRIGGWNTILGIWDKMSVEIAHNVAVAVVIGRHQYRMTTIMEHNSPELDEYSKYIPLCEKFAKDILDFIFDVSLIIEGIPPPEADIFAIGFAFDNNHIPMSSDLRQYIETKILEHS